MELSFVVEGVAFVGAELSLAELSLVVELVVVSDEELVEVVSFVSLAGLLSLLSLLLVVALLA